MVDIQALRSAADSIRKKMDASVIVLGSDANGKVALVCAVSKDIVQKGINAKDVISKVSQIVGGSGGGRPDFAQAGGKDINRLSEALDAVRGIIQEELKK